MIDYSKSKTSIFIEEQLPGFIRREGPSFVDFLETYYDWLEKRVVLLTLKATNEISEDQLTTNQLISSESYIIATEDDNLIVTENESIGLIYQDTYSLSLNGSDQYLTVANNCINVANSWSIGLWLNLTSYPSALLYDSTIVSLSSALNIVPAQISMIDNQIHGIFGSTTVDTNLDIRTGEWNYLTIRYDNIAKTISYDVFNYRGQYTYNQSLDLSANTSNYFAAGFNAYSTDKFLAGKIDNISTWNKCLSNTEIISIYNDGTSINVMLNQSNYSSNTSLTNLWEFETANTSIALNSISANNNASLIHGPSYDYDVPINVSAIITEYESTLNLLINTLSYINYEGGIEGVMSNRMLLFAEHIYGKIENDLVIYSSPENKIQIDSYTEAKNPLNVINNLANYQDIDYNMNYNNFISDASFQNLMKEIMPAFPLFLHPNHDLSIKDIVGKTIKDFYDSKGTLLSIKYLFKILYDEDLVIGTTLYSDAPYSYVIKTKYSTSTELPTIIKNLAHPIGYKLTITSP